MARLVECGRGIRRPGRTGRAGAPPGAGPGHCSLVARWGIQLQTYQYYSSSRSSSGSCFEYTPQNQRLDPMIKKISKSIPQQVLRQLCSPLNLPKLFGPVHALFRFFSVNIPGTQKAEIYYINSCSGYSGQYHFSKSIT